MMVDVWLIRLPLPVLLPSADLHHGMRLQLLAVTLESLHSILLSVGALWANDFEKIGYMFSTIWGMNTAAATFLGSWRKWTILRCSRVTQSSGIGVDIKIKQHIIFKYIQYSGFGGVMTCYSCAVFEISCAVLLFLWTTSRCCYQELGVDGIVLSPVVDQVIFKSCSFPKWKVILWFASSCRDCAGQTARFGEDLVFDRTPQPDAWMCCPVSIDVFSSGVASSLTARCHMATTATGQRISPRSTLRMVPRILGGCAERQFSAYSNTVSMILSLNVLSAWSSRIAMLQLKCESTLCSLAGRCPAAGDPFAWAQNEGDCGCQHDAQLHACYKFRITLTIRITGHVTSWWLRNHAGSQKVNASNPRDVCRTQLTDLPNIRWLASVITAIRSFKDC